VFEFLFKYRRILFEEGEVILSTPWSLGLLVGVVALVGVAAVVTYGRAGGKASAGERTLLATLRLAALGVLVFALLQPTLVLSSVVPQRNFVGILLDDSRSMNLPAGDGAPRRDWVEANFGAEGGDLVEALGERFALRFFRFSSESGRIESADELGFEGTATNLAAALDGARESLSSVPLSGLVVVTDGAENGAAALSEALIPLQAASVPVFPIGVGAELLTPDVQLSRVEVPARVLRGTGTLVDVVLTHQGMDGRTVELVVEDGPRIVTREPVELGASGEPSIVRVPLNLEEPGVRTLRFRVPVLEGEAVPENNARTRTVEVTDDREKILYFEGEPRFEVKFLRRAVRDDENLQVVVLQRTAEDKFLRLDVDGPEELLGGFPRTREELFRYRAVVLGSVEASFFTRDQLQMLSDFVGERGGGLLALGGRNALAEGGYAGTAVEDVLPVYLEEPAADPQGAFAQLRVRPTPSGELHPVGRLGGLTWDDLPPLTTLNRVTRTKPGATAILAGTTVEAGPERDGPLSLVPGLGGRSGDAVAPTAGASGEERVVLAWQRFGRGKALALPVQDTWLWQMHADVPVDDQRHEVLWQQLLRWLVDGVPEPVGVSLASEEVEVGSAVEVTATVLDSAYLEVNDATVTATLSMDGTAVAETTLPWSVDTDGRYAGELRVPGDGTWTVTVEARRGEDLLGSASSVLRAGPSREEYFDAGRRTGLLQRLAEETGGRFYTPESAADLPEDIQFTGAGVTITEERDLWDMPIILILLLGLLGAEWGIRRVRGLA
jgi:hypothetical protein